MRIVIRSLVIFLLLSNGVYSTASLAASAELRANQQPPYYAGVPIELVISATDFEENPQPELIFDAPAEGKMTLAGVSPNISSSIQIINGKMSQSKTVQFNYHLRFVVEQPGKYTVGPFQVTQGNNTVRVGGARVEVGSIPVAGDQKIRLILPSEDVYVGQRLPVKLEWWVKMNSLEKLMNPRAYVPLYGLSTIFQFYEHENAAADNQLTIGDEVFPASVREESTKNGQYAVWTVERLMVPLKPGRYEIEPASLSVDEGIRWRRDFFGRRSPSQVRKLRTVDKERLLTVKDLPLEGRPASYAGAVGRGFALEVAADRSVVQVGDPIKLILTLKGDAEVANASLPVLAQDLPPDDFRVPADKIAGVYDGDSKRFELSIRVLNDSVREIPPISYSWFDTELQQYQTTKSRPIALSVRKAQMVSAGDVIRGNDSNTDTNETDRDLALRSVGPSNTESSGNGKEGARRKTYSLSGADLSINKDKALLMGSDRSWLGASWQQVSCYFLAFSLIAMAIIVRRRSELDPETVVQQKELKQQRKRIGTTTDLKDLSDAIRRMAAVAPHVPHQEIDHFLSDCDTKVFAPGGGSVGVEEGLRERALSLAEQMNPSTRGSK